MILLIKRHLVPARVLEVVERVGPQQAVFEGLVVDGGQVLLRARAHRGRAVGEVLLVLARGALALAQRADRGFREPRGGAALEVVPRVALGGRERRHELPVLLLRELVRALEVALRNVVHGGIKIVRFRRDEGVLVAHAVLSPSPTPLLWGKLLGQNPPQSPASRDAHRN